MAGVRPSKESIMRGTVTAVATLMLLATYSNKSQMFTEPTVVDLSTYTYEKGANFQASVKQGEYEVGQFNIIFSSIVSEGQHDHMFKEIRDGLYKFVCSSCKPAPIDSEERKDGVLCQGLVYRYRTFGAPRSWTYGITISFPLQDKENLKKIRKEIDAFLKELVSTKLPNLDYSLSYSKTKQKVKPKDT